MSMGASISARGRTALPGRAAEIPALAAPTGRPLKLALTRRFSARTRRFIVLWPLLLAALSAAPPGFTQPVDDRARKLCGEANGIALELTKISGMKLHHPVPCDFITKDRINEFLNKRVKE